MYQNKFGIRDDGRIQFRNEFLNNYLDLVEDTESPRIFHIWSALSAVGACLGRRVCLPWGNKPVLANNYVLLVGPPATKKSTAMDIAIDRLKAVTRVQFAPDDTGGQRQGLLTALTRNSQKEEEDDLEKMKEELTAAGAFTAEQITMDALSKLEFNLDIDPRDKHCLLVASDEFKSLIGTNASDMTTFLIHMWNGKSYEYQLKQTQLTVEDPLLSIIGCTNPADIAKSLPPEAIGKGFMSRIILVYADKKHKSVARPAKFDPNLIKKIEDVYHTAFFKLDGEMEESEDAVKFADELYGKARGVNDSRFVYYTERRHIHFLKTGMWLAAARGSMRIERSDYEEADLLLQVTEQTMPDALGEFGLSPLATAKQRLVEFVIHANEAVSAATLWAMMHRDMKAADFQACLADLCNAGQMKRVEIAGKVKFIAVEKAKASLQDALLKLMQGDED